MKSFEKIRSQIFWILDFFKGNRIFKELNEVRRINNLEIKEITQYQNRKINKLLMYVIQNVPYYQIGNFKKLEDFPIINKNIILKNYDNFCNYKLIKKGKKVSTSGSTGTPFVSYQNKGKKKRNTADAKPFKIIKFKTMTDEKNAHGNLLPDNERITNLGSFIRKWSLDELPQLINVLKGDMSLVGPRPLLFKYIPLYSIEQRRRHEVRPGISGWAQVNGRNSISWTKKFELDIYYVDHLSFLLDIKILWLTLLKVLKRDGINQNEDRPMQPFDGLN